MTRRHAQRSVVVGGSSPVLRSRRYGDVAPYQGGFTLVELMVVIVIIGIASAVMFGEMRGTFEDTLLRGTARKIIDACDAASNLAISTHRTQLLKIDTKEGRFAIAPRLARDEERPGIDLAGDAGALDTRISMAIRQPDVEDEEGAVEETEKPISAEVISFYADGTCEAREFLLRDREGVALTLQLNPITSRVRIAEVARR